MLSSIKSAIKSITKPRFKFRLGFSLVLLLALLSSACGFRLSGFIELPQHLQPLHISSDNNAKNLADTLARQLQQSGIAISKEINASRLRLALSTFESNQRQVVFGSTETFELSLKIIASASNSEGEPLFTNQPFQAYRQYSYQRDSSLLARDSLRRELLRSMENDLIRQLTLRIQALQQ
ncbi:MAG TPA: hypothetical protein VJY63_05045 [Marinospirillum sp.]|uniref:LPS-assembly lipoprotein LptE n=1 Tax=Marinospirillum sp. TaxID=2183934 RepID=UPI002B46F4EC|nr:hypothetical protein [Marinospirillum sp.]HKM15274.1 hypothetical protein [Marinospirillum sp.]